MSLETLAMLQTVRPQTADQPGQPTTSPHLRDPSVDPSRLSVRAMEAVPER